MSALLSRRGCAGHRAALLEFAARRAGGPDVRRALDHLERCPDCEAELAATTLVIHGLRRLHDEVGRVEPPPDSWSRLRARLASRPRPPSPLMTCMPGAAIAIALVVALSGPFAGRGDRAVFDDGPAPLRAPVSVDDGSRFEPLAAPRTTVVVVPFTWRRQDLPRPSVPQAGRQARDVLTRNGVEPAAMEPAGTLEEAAPTQAPARWR